MKLSLSLFFAATALLSASGTIAGDPAPGSSGCSDGYCWGSCYNDESGLPTMPKKDSTATWEEGKPWCWIMNTNHDLYMGREYRKCDKDCSRSLEENECDLTEPACLT